MRMRTLCSIDIEATNTLLETIFASGLAMLDTNKLIAPPLTYITVPLYQLELESSSHVSYSVLRVMDLKLVKMGSGTN